MENKKYDVFISCRSNDYDIASKLYHFLKGKGVRVFFSEKTLPELGDSDYQDVIFENLNNSDNLIVVCSNADYLKKPKSQNDNLASGWVYKEWSKFIKLKLDKIKPNANIVTLYTSSVIFDNLPDQLRDNECRPYEKYEEFILNYVKKKKTEEPNPAIVPDPVLDPATAPAPVPKEPSLIERLINSIKRIFTKRLLTPLLAVLLGLLLGSSLFFCERNQDKSNEAVLSTDSLKTKNTLIYAGGGSVVAFLDSFYSQSAKNCFKSIPDTSKNIFSTNQYPNSMYLHMPSGTAMTLLVEEAIMPKSTKYQDFYPICLSAMKADVSMFTKTCNSEQILKKGVIVGYYLGEDSMVVYVNNMKELNSIGISASANEITVSQLRNLLSQTNKTYKIFTTSNESGTYYAYNSELKKEKSSDDKIVDLDSISDTDKKLFSSQSEQQYFAPSGESYIILGSELYYPTELNALITTIDKSVRPLSLVDDSHKKCTHPLYLYFMAYEENGDYIVPERILELLKRVFNFQDKNSLLDGDRLKIHDKMMLHLNPYDEPSTNQVRIGLNR